MLHILAFVSHILTFLSHDLTVSQILLTLLLQESQELIVKCQQQERKVSSWNRQTDDTAEDTPLSDVPPAPLLLYRSSNVLVFRPAPFKSNGGEKVRNID